MNTSTGLVGAMTVALLTFGCALREPAIELSAADSDLNPLVGKWRGEYLSQETGRTGDISFTLKSGESEASGAVVMSPRTDVTNTVSADRPMVLGVINGTPSRVLTIHFVRKEGREDIGVLDPYVSPDCACKVTTRFQGALVNWRTIEGIYVTSSSDIAYTPTHGSWKVTLLNGL
jgi:hypothetical protein